MSAAPAPTPDQFAHFLEMPVRWGDMDALGHVNNARFFTYDESVRLDYFAPIIKGDPDFWTRHGFILASISCDFLSQLKPPADMQLGFRIARLGRSSMRSESCVFVERKPIAVVRGVICWFDYAAQKTAPIPEHIRQSIIEREVVPPAQ